MKVTALPRQLARAIDGFSGQDYKWIGKDLLIKGCPLSGYIIKRFSTSHAKFKYIAITRTKREAIKIVKESK